MKKLTEKITQFIENFKNVHAEARKIGFAGIMNLLWKDLFVVRRPRGSGCWERIHRRITQRPIRRRYLGMGPGRTAYACSAL